MVGSRGEEHSFKLRNIAPTRAGRRRGTVEQCPTHSSGQCVNKSPIFSILYRVPKRLSLPYP